MLRLGHHFTRCCPLTRSLITPSRRPLISTVQQHVRSMSDHHDFKPERVIVQERKTSLNDIPVPQGSWQSYHSSRNTKWNMYLGASIAFFGVTMFTMWKTGVWYLHTTPEMKNKKDVAAPTAASDASPPPPSGPVKPADVGAAGTAAAVSSEVAAQVDLTALPDHVPYLIIGGGTAAFSAFRAIRSKDPTAKILVVSSEGYAPYMRPPLSKEFWFSEDRNLLEQLKFKQWNGRERSIFFEKEAFYCQPGELNTKTTGGVALALNKRVAQLNIENQTAVLEDGTEIKYDKCLLATGGKPKNLKVFEKAGPEVMKRSTLFRTIEDFRNLEQITANATSVAIVGGGFLGSELACALGKKGKSSGLNVIQVFPEKGNMGNILPEYLSRWTKEKVEGEGVRVITNATVKNCSLHGNSVDLHLNNGDKVTVDHVVVAVGLEPNTELAKASGLEISPEHGGFLVNAELEARSNIWVAGDAACFYDTRLGRRRVEHHDHAVVSGRLAGENMTGAHKPYSHQSMFWSDLGPNIGYEAIGIVDSSLPTVAVFAKADERDTPKAVVEATGEGLRSETEQSAAAADNKVTFQAPKDTEDYGKGIVFYLRDNTVVGLVMWNVFGKMPIARKILKENVKEDEISEISKLFNLYGDKATS